EPAHLEIPTVDIDVASIGTLGADACRPLQVPGSRDESVLPVGERAHRADLGKIPLDFRLHRLVIEGRHQGVDATLLENDLLLTGDLVVVADAAPAEDASLLI